MRLHRPRALAHLPTSRAKLSRVHWHPRIVRRSSLGAGLVRWQPRLRGRTRPSKLCTWTFICLCSPLALEGGGSKPSDASDDGKADEGCGAVERDATDFDVIEGNDYDLDGDDTNERDAIGLSGHPDEEEDKNEEKDEEEDFEESQCAS